MDAARKKALAAEYRSKIAQGGVYLIENTQNGRCVLRSCADLAGAENRFRFAQATKSCVEPKLQSDWGDGSAFRLVVIDRLAQKEEWDDRRFREKLGELEKLWKSQLEKEWY